MQFYRLREGIDFDGSLKLRYFSQIVTEGSPNNLPFQWIMAHPLILTVLQFTSYRMTTR